MIDAIFFSPSMKDVYRAVERVARTDVPVLISGETGTGKEVIADLLHQISHRCHGPLVKVNCAAIPRELFEAELFGAARGAYTGSLADRAGYFKECGKGTLILDELAETPVDLQSKLLRVLQNGIVRPVGSNKGYHANCRIVTCTNQDVSNALRSGRLRADLYYRVAGYTIEIPPLRDRPSDIMPLARAYLKLFAARAKRSTMEFSADAAKLLRQHHWPGNVRELVNEIQRAVLVCDGELIETSNLSPRLRWHGRDARIGSIAASERETIVKTLALNQGNKEASARRLGISKATLYRKLKTYTIRTLEFDPYRPKPEAVEDASEEEAAGKHLAT